MTFGELPMQVCDACAAYRGLASLSSEGMRYGGIYLLRLSAELPRRCVDAKCGGLWYDAKCATCRMFPTVCTAPHVERLLEAKHAACCTLPKTTISSGASSPDVCSKCREMVFRLHAMETDFAAERMERVDSGGADAMLRAGLLKTDQFHVDHVFCGLDEVADTVELEAALVCSSVCYEYSAFPQLTLKYSDIPVAQTLSLLFYSQDYALFQGANRTMYIAFPGTHDARTAMTDLKFSRTTVTHWSKGNDGVTRCGPAVNRGVCKLWEYKVHQGFLEEAKKLMFNLPTGLLQRWVDKGFRVVLTGHSLGGALAALVTLQHLLEDPARFHGRSIRCFTFGCPMVGDTRLRRVVERCGWKQLFHHVVYRSDLVARVGCGHELPREIRAKVERKVQELSKRVVDAVQSWFSKPQTAAEATDASSDPQCMDALENSIESPDMSRANSDECDDAQVQPDASNPRALDCFGVYHFLFRVATSPDSDTPSSSAKRMAYRGTDSADEAFGMLKKSQGIQTNMRDHLLDSYNQAIALVLRRVAPPFA